MVTFFMSLTASKTDRSIIECYDSLSADVIAVGMSQVLIRVLYVQSHKWPVNAPLFPYSIMPFQHGYGLPHQIAHRQINDLIAAAIKHRFERP